MNSMLKIYKVMKRRLACFATLFVLCVTSCDLMLHDQEDYYRYDLTLSFQDASGNDLVKGIESTQGGSVMTGQYTLSVVYPESCMKQKGDPYGLYHTSNPLHSVDLVFLQIAYPKRGCSFAEMLTFKLSCPHIFGDDKVHEIVTYWTIEHSRRRIPDINCYRIVLDGNENTHQINQMYLTIIMENR